MKKLYEIVINPISAITKAKKEKNLSFTFLVLIVAWILIAAAVTFVYKFGGRTTLTELTSLDILISIFVGGLFVSLLGGMLVKIVMVILGGKGKYFEGLTSLAYSILPLSKGFLLAAIFSLLSIYGIMLSFIVLIIFCAISVSVFFRSIKELFGTDTVTTWVGVGIMSFTIILTFSIINFCFPSTLSLIRA